MSLQLTFVSPSNWMLDKDLSSAGVRVKIENGVVFFKPAGAGTTADVLEINFQLDDDTWKARVSDQHPMIDRLFAQLERLGWSRRQPYFELHAAQRGWHGISLRPRRQKPKDCPHVRVRKVLSPRKPVKNTSS